MTTDDDDRRQTPASKAITGPLGWPVTSDERARSGHTSSHRTQSVNDCVVTSRLAILRGVIDAASIPCFSLQTL